MYYINTDTVIVTTQGVPKQSRKYQSTTKITTNFISL